MNGDVGAVIGGIVLVSVYAGVYYAVHRDAPPTKSFIAVLLAAFGVSTVAFVHVPVLFSTDRTIPYSNDIRGLIFVGTVIVGGFALKTFVAEVMSAIREPPEKG